MQTARAILSEDKDSIDEVLVRQGCPAGTAAPVQGPDCTCMRVRSERWMTWVESWWTCRNGKQRVSSCVCGAFSQESL
eukprot:scaffold1017_cov374-Prasinococcus_capsulatus_cf.AAC.2